MKILVIGSGGREHALAHTFHRQGHVVYCLPGNAGTQEMYPPLSDDWQSLNVHDFERLIRFVKHHQIELTVVGPEEYLEKGIANAFAKHRLSLFGPTKEAALLETNKAWAKDFMQRNEIPTARFKISRNLKEAKDALQTLSSHSQGIVIKQSGLAGGKGVFCFDHLIEAEQHLIEAYGSDPDTPFVIEERLTGPEISLLAFSDGKSILPMIPSQDHKRLLDGDKGPNTGGMGAYAPVPFITPSLMNEIMTQIADKTVKGLKKEKIPYTGILYFGLMLTKNGPKVLEYNCRFGDPETQALLPLLKTDLASIMMACCLGWLDSCKLSWEKKYSCCVVMASDGYPGNCSLNEEIKGLNHFTDNAVLFHAATKKGRRGEILSSGGRVLGVTGLGSTLHEAVQQAYSAVSAIAFPTGLYRRDVGHQGLRMEKERFAYRD